MLSFGWPEMLIVAAVALIVVGPRDLPVLLRNIGRFLGKIRRMGNDFKAEINKAAAIDEIKDIKQQITQPISDTRAEIEQEFNKINLDGSVEPSGKIKPKNPDAASVYDEIVSASKTKQEDDSSFKAKESMKDAVTKAINAKKEQEAALKEKTAAKAKKAPKPNKADLVKKSGGPANKKTKKTKKSSPARTKRAIKQDS